MLQKEIEAGISPKHMPRNNLMEEGAILQRTEQWNRRAANGTSESSPEDSREVSEDIPWDRVPVCKTLPMKVSASPKIVAIGRLRCPHPMDAMTVSPTERLSTKWRNLQPFSTE
jgi:hypothetical protein